MDVGNLVPDSWFSRILDIAGVVMLGMLKMVHGSFKDQVKTVQTLVTEHAVFKANIENINEGLSEVKDNTQTIMKILMNRHG